MCTLTRAQSKSRQVKRINFMLSSKAQEIHIEPCRSQYFERDAVRSSTRELRHRLRIAHACDIPASRATSLTFDSWSAALTHFGSYDTYSCPSSFVACTYGSGNAIRTSIVMHVASHNDHHQIRFSKRGNSGGTTRLGAIRTQSCAPRSCAPRCTHQRRLSQRAFLERALFPLRSECSTAGQPGQRHRASARRVSGMCTTTRHSKVFTRATPPPPTDTNQHTTQAADLTRTTLMSILTASK
jgi:hypothetical protein